MPQVFPPVVLSYQLIDQMMWIAEGGAAQKKQQMIMS